MDNEALGGEVQRLIKNTKYTQHKMHKNMEMDFFSPALSFIQHFHHVGGLGNSCGDLSRTKRD